MFRSDRFTQTLLVLIVLLLGALLARPYLADSTPEAVAQTVESINGDKIVLGYKTLKIGMVSFPEELTHKQVHIVDSAQSIVVEYDDGMVIYRIVEDSVSADRLRRRN